MDELAVGRLGAPHGLDGCLKVTSYSGEIEHLLTLKVVDLRKAGSALSLDVEDVSSHGEGVLMKFRGYDSPEAAKALAGYEIWVPRDKATPLEDDEYYYGDLVGCTLQHDGTPMARVEAVCDTGGGQLLEVVLPDGKSAYVPFRNEFVGAVDIGGKRIELIAPWILE
ncbi:MAG: 16S rRNA processing protein RimM [Spirochaetales bacterium]|nr:MAG: 16S rRNA processing protein RimM [Spirochaetales bacterium]